MRHTCAPTFKHGSRVRFAFSLAAIEPVEQEIILVQSLGKKIAFVVNQHFYESTNVFWYIVGRLSATGIRHILSNFRRQVCAQPLFQSMYSITNWRFFGEPLRDKPAVWLCYDIGLSLPLWHVE